MDIDALSSEHCISCEGTSPLTVEQAKNALTSLEGWSMKDGSIEKEFRFESYLAGLNFAFAIGKLAEFEDHHPDMTVGWRRVRLVWTTHSIKGLSRNDLIMAAKSEKEFENAAKQIGGVSITR